MASTDAIPLPRKNIAYRLYFEFRDNTGSLISTVTGADTERSLDGAAFADCTNEFTEIGTSGCGYIDLTTSEMNADAVYIKATCTNTNSRPFTTTIYPQEVGDVRVDLQSIGAADVTTDGAVPAFAVSDQGTAQAATSTTLQLRAAAAFADSELVGQVAEIVSSTTGAGQTRNIVAYVGSTDTATIDPPWTTTPTGTIVYKVRKVPPLSPLAPVGNIVRSSTAQAGAASSITLDSSASSVTDFYNYGIIQIVAGTGVGQQRFITAYNGSTKVATVARNWSTNPDNTSKFIITAFDQVPGASAPTAAQVADAVWDELRADHVTASTFGNGVPAYSLSTNAINQLLDEALAGHVTSGSFAVYVKNILSMLDDVRGEPAQGAPPVNPDMATKVDYLYKAWRNRQTQSASQYSLYADNATTVDHKATFTDDGTTADRGELASGP